MKVQPPPPQPLDGGGTKIHLRARRRSTDESYPVPVILVLSGLILAFFLCYVGGVPLPWVLAISLGMCAFFIYALFAYTVEKRRHTRRWRLRSSFVRVILPGFPVVILSLFLMAVWLGLLGVLSTWSPFLLFVALLGVSVTLFISKILQWYLESFRRTRGSSDAGPGRATDRSGEDSIPSGE